MLSKPTCISSRASARDKTAEIVDSLTFFLWGLLFTLIAADRRARILGHTLRYGSYHFSLRFFSSLIFVSQQFSDSFIMNKHKPGDGDNRLEHGCPVTFFAAETLTRCLLATLLPTIVEISRTSEHFTCVSRLMVRLHAHSPTARGILSHLFRSQFGSESSPLSLGRECGPRTFRMMWPQSPAPAPPIETESNLAIAANMPKSSKLAKRSSPQL